MIRFVALALLALPVAVIATPASAGPGFDVPGSWSTGASMPTARTEVTSAIAGVEMYVMGGFPSSGGHTNVVEAYDLAGNSWSTKAPMPQALDHTGAATVSGKIYVVGGYVNFGQSTMSAATYEYDPGMNTWTQRAAMPFARAAAATVAVNGIIYVLGGVGPSPTIPLAYNPSSNTWSQLAPMSAAREHLTASVVDGKIYVVGGRQFVTQNVNTVAMYDPAANAWTPKAAMPSARGGLASGTLDGRIHVVGGEDLSPGGTTFEEHEVYDPTSNTWLTAPDLPTPRHGLAAQSFLGKLYVIGGGPTPGFSYSSAVEIFRTEGVGGTTRLTGIDDSPSPAPARAGPAIDARNVLATLGLAAVVGSLGGFWIGRRRRSRRSPS